MFLLHSWNFVKTQSGKRANFHHFSSFFLQWVKNCLIINPPFMPRHFHVIHHPLPHAVPIYRRFLEAWCRNSAVKYTCLLFTRCTGRMLMRGACIWRCWQSEHSASCKNQLWKWLTSPGSSNEPRHTTSPPPHLSVMRPRKGASGIIVFSLAMSK